MTNYGKKISILFIGLGLNAFVQEACADITINSPSSTPIVLSQTDNEVTIESGGSLDISSSDIAIYGSSRSDFIVTLNANSGDGITSTSSPAIYIFNGALDLNINSGRIATPSASGEGALHFQSASGGTSFVDIAAGSSLRNTAGAGGTAIKYITVGSASSNLTIDNQGTIGAENNSGSFGVYFVDTSGGSVLTFVNHGTLTAGVSGRAIFVGGENVGTITNSGSIVGSITGGTAAFNISNSGSIAGNVSLGSSASSSVTIDGGSMIGNLTFGNSNQIFNINSGSMIGNVSGVGNFNIGSGGSLEIGSSSGTISTADFTSLINGLAVSGVGDLVIGAAQDVTAGYDIGSTRSLSLVMLNSGSTLRLDQENRALNATTISLDSGSSLYVGTSAINGNIISRTADNVGNIYFTGNNSLVGSLGSADAQMNRVELSSSVVLNSGSHDILATDLVLNSSATLNSSANLSGNITLGSSSIINLSDNSSLGTLSLVGLRDVDGAGTINTLDGHEEIYSAIGQNVTISALNIAENSEVDAFSDIAASTISLVGQLNLEKSSGNNLAGNLTGSGSGNLNLNNFSHSLDGALTLASGNSLTTEIITRDIVGNISVSGVVTIDANSSLLLSLSGVTKVGLRYTLITGGGGSSIQKISDSNISIEGIGLNYIGGYSFTTSSADNNLYLNIERYKIPEIVNSNQRPIYDNITDIVDTNGSLEVLQDYLDSNSNSINQKLAALESANSQVDNSVNRILFDNVNKALDTVMQRVKQLNYNQLTGLNSGDGDLKKSAWVELITSNSHQGNTTRHDGYNVNSDGIIIGIDRKLENDVVAGAAVLYSTSAIKSALANKKTNLTTYQINFYAGKNFESFFINAAAGIGSSTYYSRRVIAVADSSATAKYAGSNYVARFEAGKNLKLKNDFILTPLVMLTAARNSIADYEEGGAGTLNLKVKNDSATFFESRVGAVLSRSCRFSPENVVTHFISLSYGYDFGGDRQKTTTNFVGQTSTFDSAAAKIAQGSTKAGVGLKIYNINDISVSAGYELDQRAKYHSHNGFVRAKYEF